MPEPDVQHIEDIGLSNTAAPDTAENQQVKKKRNEADRKASSPRNGDKGRPELITIGPFWRDGNEHYATRVRLADTDDRKCLSPTPIKGRQLGAPVLDWSQVTPQEDEPAADDAFVSEKVNTDVQMPFRIPPDTEYIQRGRRVRQSAKRYHSLDIHFRRQEPPKRWNRRLGRYVDVNSPADLELNDSQLSEPAQQQEEGLEIPAEQNFLDLPVRRKENGPPAWTQKWRFSNRPNGTQDSDSHGHTSSSQSGNYVLSDKPKPQGSENLDVTASDVPRAMHVPSSPEFDVEEALVWAASEVSQHSERKSAAGSVRDDVS